MKRYLSIIAVPIMLISSCATTRAPIKNITWTLAAKVQNSDGTPSLGFAGAINAVTNDVLLVAGGANFPEKMPWDGGSKHFTKEIHILEKSGDGFVWNANSRSTLPIAIAYAGYTSTDLGVVYAGGENNGGISKAAYLLTWNKARQIVEVKPLPDLPLALTNLALTHLDNVVYAIGGDEQKQSSRSVFCLDLDNQSAQWQILPELPVALANALVVAQQGRIYVIGGRTKTTSGISDLQHSTYVYDPAKKSWESLAPVSDGKNVMNFSAGAGVALAKDFILVTGGDDGKIFHQIENYISQIAKSNEAAKKAALIKEKNRLNINHTGFNQAILLYDVKKNQWTKIDDLPFPAQVTTTASMWDGNIVLSNGEVSPGVRTPNVMLGKIK
jgi:N-acetylneuraminate epimerase